MRVALVHDWLTGMRGGEKVLAAIGKMFPQADLFTLVHVRGTCPSLVAGRKVVTSFLDRLPWVGRYYRHLLPIMPWAIERLDLSGYDLVISSSHCVAKGVCAPPEAVHVCYCHTPMRYVWSQNGEYDRRLSWAVRSGMKMVRGYLREWDRHSAERVDLFVANSRNVAGRIRQAYGRESRVVWPPIDMEYFHPDSTGREDFYLIVSALAPYKCIDHAVEAFTRLNLPLRVIGSGQMLRSLRRRASSHIQFLGWQSDEVVRAHYRRCKALVFPGEEDFGMAPLEAMACGTPVLAYGAGGAMETVIDPATANEYGPTGLHYSPHTVEALVEAVRRVESGAVRFDPRVLRAWAEQFSLARFAEQFQEAIDVALEAKGRVVLC